MGETENQFGLEVRARTIKALFKKTFIKSKVFTH